MFVTNVTESCNDQHKHSELEGKTWFTCDDLQFINREEVPYYCGQWSERHFKFVTYEYRSREIVNVIDERICHTSKNYVNIHTIF